MTDTPQPLYAPREPVFPRRVSGPFRRLKWWIMIVTLGIYSDSMDPMGSRTEPARSGGAGRSGAPPVLFLLDRDLAA